MSTYTHFSHLILFILAFSLSASAAFFPSSNENRANHLDKLEQREICEPCGVYCCSRLEFCHQDLLFDDWSDPYCRPFKKSGTKTGTDETRTHTRIHTRSDSAIYDRTASWTHADNTPTFVTVTSTFSTKDKNFDDYPWKTRTESIQITVTSKIDGLPTPTVSFTGSVSDNGKSASQSTTDTPSNTLATTATVAGTLTTAGNVFSTSTITGTPNNGVNNKRQGLTGNGGQLMVTGLMVFCLFCI